MIQVHCAACDADFEVGDESAGSTEFCPACGSLNDIPNDEDADSAAEVESATQPSPLAEAPASMPVPPPRRGVPAPLWWTLIILGICSFTIACVFMFSDNWESRHVQALSDAANRGDVLMTDEDYAGAAREYQSVIDAVGNRPIESTFIQSVLERSRRGAADAHARLRAAPPAAPAASQPSPAVAATLPDDQNLIAMRIFQRQSEALIGFVRARPFVFQDQSNKWRRRQFTVWDVSYDQRPDAQPPEIVVQYSCASSTTEAHEDRIDAAGDANYAIDEGPNIIHCQAWCEKISGRWCVVRQQADVDSSTRRMQEIFDLVQQDFTVPPQDTKSPTK